jgi:hypothetical protein
MDATILFSFSFIFIFIFFFYNRIIFLIRGVREREGVYFHGDYYLVHDTTLSFSFSFSFYLYLIAFLDNIIFSLINSKKQKKKKREIFLFIHEHYSTLHSPFFFIIKLSSCFKERERERECFHGDYYLAHDTILFSFSIIFIFIFIFYFPDNIIFSY